jgi:hypothetical protein
MNTFSKRTTAWGTEMKNRYFWGMPHSETDVAAFKATIVGRTEAVAAGKFAAVAFLEHALERVTRRSSSLLLADTLLTIVVMLLTYKAGADQVAIFLQLNRWAFACALVACVILATNLSLVWASDAARHYGDPDAGFDFTMNIYKGRAWRYTMALVLSFAAFALTLASITQMK